MTKAILIAKRKMEQKPHPEKKEKKKTPVKERKLFPVKNNELPEVEEKVHTNHCRHLKLDSSV